MASIRVLHVTNRQSTTDGLLGKHLSRLAWELSRSPDDETRLDRILAIDAPVNEIPSAVINVTCSVLERELFTTPRDHVMWARTSRVDDPADMIPADSLRKYFHRDNSSLLAFYEARDRMCQIKAEGKELQDNYRMGLLLSAETSFTTTINLRSLIKLIQSMVELRKMYAHMAPLSSLIYELKRVAADLVGGGESGGILEADDIVSTLLSTYKSPHYFTTPTIIPPTSGTVGGVLVVTAESNLSLRAQVVRHRTLHVEDNFSALLARPDVWLLPIGHPCMMQISAPITIWKGILSKRMCWIAQHDLWKVVIDKAMEHMPPTSVEAMLPCADGQCPYVRDAELRYTPADPGPVCPRFAQLQNRPIPLDQKALVERTSRGRRFWESLTPEYKDYGSPSK